jgi:hypothetical protein
MLTDETGYDSNLGQMTRMFASLCTDTVTVKNIHDIDFKNGCLGCCTCGYDNTCIQKDGFKRFYDENLKPEQIRDFARSFELAANNDMETPSRFYGTGGNKIFRDFIYATSAVFRADHLFYKKMGTYKDFPVDRSEKEYPMPFFIS